MSSQPSRPWRKSAPFRVEYPLIAEALSAPLQGGLRFLRLPLPPPPSPPLRSGYRHLAVAGRVGLTLLFNVGMRVGGVRPIVRRGPGAPPAAGSNEQTTPQPLLPPPGRPFWP